jgi:hypothetical protein
LREKLIKIGAKGIHSPFASLRNSAVETAAQRISGHAASTRASQSDQPSTTARASGPDRDWRFKASHEFDCLPLGRADMRVEGNARQHVGWRHGLGFDAG